MAWKLFEKLLIFFSGKIHHEQASSVRIMIFGFSYQLLTLPEIKVLAEQIEENQS